MTHMGVSLNFPYFVKAYWGEVVDLFLRKPFCSFLSVLSILGSMQLLSRVLYILAATGKVNYHLQDNKICLSSKQVNE